MEAFNGKEALVESSDSVVVPSKLLNINVSAFISKTYDMVDDPANHRLVSWSPMNNSFIVKDEQEFAKVLLPKYFKHNNFASFRRQLNNYGFKRLDLDRWEFENEGFIRGKRHLLSSIAIREPAHEHNKQSQQTHGLSSRVDKYAEFDKSVCREPAHAQNQQTRGQSSRVDMYAEFDNYVIDEEIKRLKRDNNMLLQGVVESRKQQQTTDAQLEAIVQRIHVMKQKHQEMRSILFKDANIPDFSAQCVEGRNESSMLTTEGSKKRRLEPDDHLATPDGHSLSHDLDFIRDRSSIEEMLKSIDFSGEEFPVSSPLGIDVEEMNSTPPGAPQHISDAVPDDHPVTLDGQILSPGIDFIWDSSFDEILKSIDFSDEEFPVSSPLGINAEEMDTTPPAAPQHTSDAESSKK